MENGLKRVKCRRKLTYLRTVAMHINVPELPMDVNAWFHHWAYEHIAGTEEIRKLAVVSLEKTGEFKLYEEEDIEFVEEF